MNPMIQSITNEFAAANNFSTLDVSTQFEYLVNYLAVLENFTGTFDIASISTGQKEFGIDGIAITVTGSLVQDSDEIDDILNAPSKSYLDVQFIVIQSKSGANFDSGDIAKTFAAAYDFFTPGQLIQGEVIEAAREIKDQLYMHPGRFRPNVPLLKIYYATTGEWTGDQNLIAIANQGKQKLDALGIFRDIQFIPLDRTQIRDSYYASLRSDTATLKFKERVSLPSVQGVKPSYLGYVRGQDLVDIVNNNGKIKEHLFFDNMRDFQDGSRANSEIENTLQSSNKHEFILLNNGITIVCKKLTQSGDDFVLEDFQIVNGCQTTHVLFNNKNHLNESIFVPIRIICVDDEGIVNRIIRGTNTSNSFDDTQLWATDDFHKLLETFFNQTSSNVPKLAYERRKGQHRANQSVPKSRVVDPKSLLKAASAIYDRDPQDATKYVSRLYPKVGKQLFRSGQRLYCYYVAALLDSTFSELVQTKRLPKDLRPCRYHMIMAVKLLFDQTTGPDSNVNAEKALAPLVSEMGNLDNAAATFAFVEAEVRAYAKAQGEARLSRLAKMVGLRDHMLTWATSGVCHVRMKPTQP